MAAIVIQRITMKDLLRCLLALLVATSLSSDIGTSVESGFIDKHGTLVSESSVQPKEMGEENIALRIKKAKSTENPKELKNLCEEDFAFRIKKAKPAENFKEMGNLYEENFAFRLRKAKSIKNPEEIETVYEEHFAIRIKNNPKSENSSDCAPRIPEGKKGKQSENLDSNPEEMGDFFEGDIIVDPINLRNGVIENKWPNGVIPFEIQGAFNIIERAIIRTAMKTFHKYTCVRFVPRKEQTSWIQITSYPKGGCSSRVGHYGGAQKLNLQRSFCFKRFGTVVHELMHAAGFHHEHTRPDRDNYVRIECENIIFGKESNFNKAKSDKVSSYGFPYDYDSVMHYSKVSSSRNKKPTIIPKKRNAVIGQRIGLSITDVKKINKMYNCKY